ncbi:hypothetical protein [Cupriavidus sp. SK-3]|nr:hypothetical protein [Cupriavidus sp. SK-3]
MAKSVKPWVSITANPQAGAAIEGVIRQSGSEDVAQLAGFAGSSRWSG